MTTSKRPRTSLVFLITNTYPFGKGEEFIEAEIGHLAKSSDRVIIVATQSLPGAAQTRHVPDNCVVLRAGDPRPSGWQAIGAVANGALCRITSSWKGLPLDPAKLGMEAMFEGRAQNSWRLLRPQLVTPEVQSLIRSADQVIIYSYWLHVTARVGMLLATWLRGHDVAVTRLVSRSHRYDLFPEAATRGFIPERRMILNAYDAIHPVSDQGTAVLHELFPEYAAKVSTRRLGSADPGPVIACSQRPVDVASCSYVVPVKRVDRFPSIMARASDMLGSPVRWTHFGDGDALEALQNETRTQQEQGLIRLNGHTPHDQLDQAYRELRPTVFLNLSESEGVPVTIMEVIALGIPVIATDVGGVREIVKDGVNGFLLPRDFTDEQAASLVAKVASAPSDLYQSWCEAARRIWEDGYNQAKNYPSFVEELFLSPSSR